MKIISKNKIKELTILSQKVRKDILQMVTASKSSHIGSAFSMVEIIVVLYKLILKNDRVNPKDPERDRFLLSKGHACTALYSLLAELGYFEKELLKEFTKDGGILMSHINSEVSGVEFSTGSLGHALPVGLGIALAAKNRNEKWRTFVLLSDGELNEGSNWEAFLMAPQLKLSSLIVIVDSNTLQGLGFAKDIINMDPLDKKFEAFGWNVEIVDDGHDFVKIFNSVQKLITVKSDKPSIVIANTIKGKGISFMENKLSWHYKSPSEEEYKLALQELEK